MEALTDIAWFFAEIALMAGATYALMRAFGNH